MRTYQSVPQNKQSMLKEIVALKSGATASIYSTQYWPIYRNSPCSEI